MSWPWWSGLAAVELSVSCAGAAHRVVWADGALLASDHPDAERERALAALGADPYTCLELLDLWNRHTDDLDVLLLASRGPADPLESVDEDEAIPFVGHWHHPAAAASAQPGRAFGWTAYAPMRHGSRMPARYSHDPDERSEVEQLLLLGSRLPDRLVATVVATWAERVERDDERVRAALPALRAALYGRLRATVTTWLGTHTAVEVDLAPAAAQPAVSGDRTALRFALPFSWLRDVWGKGLAITLGMLCLAAEHPDDDQWRLLAVAPPNPDLAPAISLVAQVAPADR